MKKPLITMLCICVLLSVSSFAQERHVTRMQCIIAIISYCDIDLSTADESAVCKFSDVPEFSSQQQKQYICAAIQNSIINGYEDNTLRLDGNVTRGEFACMLYRAKDFCEPVSMDKIFYEGTYSDLSDWNKLEIYFCIENGYMMGYGNIFGASDSITQSQLDIITNRMRFGLTSREKYTLMQVCGNCPIPMEDILSSAHSAELKQVILPSRNGEKVYSSDSAQTARKLENLMKLQGNMDWEKLNSGNYVNHISKSFYDLVYENIKRPTVISDGKSHKTIDDIITNAKENKIKRESIFVLCPSNNMESSFVNYGRTVGTGYEYYRYTEIQGDTPNDEEIGVWYKRRVDIDYTEYLSVSADNHDLICKYGTPTRFTK